MSKISRLPAVIDRTGKSRSSIYLDVKKGTFPKPVKIGERASGWFDEEIDTWMKQQRAYRDQAAR